MIEKWQFIFMLYQYSDFSKLLKIQDAGLIKSADEKADPKLRRYIPYWA